MSWVCDDENVQQCPGWKKRLNVSRRSTIPQNLFIIIFSIKLVVGTLKETQNSYFCVTPKNHRLMLVPWKFFSEIHQRFKGHFLNELRVTFNNSSEKLQNAKAVFEMVLQNIDDLWKYHWRSARFVEFVHKLYSKLGNQLFTYK